MNNYRSGIPTELKDITGWEEFSATGHYESTFKDQYMLTCAGKTKSSGKKNVLLLSTTRTLKR